jgi:hypothetical protein
MIDFIVEYNRNILFGVLCLAIGYWFLDLRTLPEEHWVSRSANQVRSFFGEYLGTHAVKDSQVRCEIAIGNG